MVKSPALTNKQGLNCIVQNESSFGWFGWMLGDRDGRQPAERTPRKHNEGTNQIVSSSLILSIAR
jgi:hypothetical protein